jgi:hypothetical protein
MARQSEGYYFRWQIVFNRCWKKTAQNQPRLSRFPKLLNPVDSD